MKNADTNLYNTVDQLFGVLFGFVASIFAFSLRLGIVLSVLFAVFSFPMAHFYGKAELVPVGMLISIQLLFNTLNVVPNALLLKQKEFKKVALRILCACLLSGGVGIGLAAAGLRYYALVIQAITQAAFIFGWNYFSTRPRLAGSVNRNSLDKIRSYSGYLFGFNLINYFARNTDNLLIGKVMGAAPLGYYDKSYKLHKEDKYFYNC
jgi:PST family polysaccharide transporter